MKLYYKSGACSLAVRIALEEAGLPYEAEAVDLPTKTTESGADFWAINPKGYIPALVLDDGTVLSEGASILLRIATMAPDKHLAPAPGNADYGKTLEWLVFIATELHKPTGGLFNPAIPEEVKTASKGILARRLSYADQTLGAGPFLLGNAFTVADAYLFNVMLWLPRVGIDIAAWPNLAAHHARIGARPAVLAALKAEGLA